MVTAIGASGLIRSSDTLRSETAKRSEAAKAAAPDMGEAVPTNPVALLVAAGAPIDADRVSSLRQAIAEGRYAIDPQAIADRMIAADLPPRP